MGCISSKSMRTDEFDGELLRRQDSVKVTSSNRRTGVSSRKEEVVLVREDAAEWDSRTRLVRNGSEKGTATPLLCSVQREIENEVVKVTEKLPERPRMKHKKHGSVDEGASAVEDAGLWNERVPKQIEGDQVAVGWPEWLAAVAGEAINGWVPRRPESFEKLHKIGQGTYSNVYKAKDLETGQVVALKKVHVAIQDPESVRFMAREIHILRRLCHPNVVKLEGLVTSQNSSSLYLVFEYMEHDLAGLAGNPDIRLTVSQVKCYMQQLLRGLEHCHTRGVLHRDIKASNLLINNNGILQIADFGLANSFDPDQKHPLTSRVVTLWYRPPELLLGATQYGVGVDLWSTGCVLAELLTGMPIMPGRTEVEQLHRIFKLCGSPSEEYWKTSNLPHATVVKPQQPYVRCVAETFKDFPASTLSLLDTLLAIEPTKRGTASSALKSDFFTTKPLPCDPSSLPRFPPSKEFDLKLCKGPTRQGATEGNMPKPQTRSRVPRESTTQAVPDENAEMTLRLQQSQCHLNLIGGSKKYDTEMQDQGFKSSNTMPLGIAHNGFSHAGDLLHPSGFQPGRDREQKDVDADDRPGVYGGISGDRTTGLTNMESKSERFYVPSKPSEQHSTNFEVSNGKRGYQKQKVIEKYSLEQYKCSPLESLKLLENEQWTQHLLERRVAAHKNDDRINDSAAGYRHKKNMFQHSGPLLHATGNLDELLKERNEQIRQVLRKVRLDKAKMTEKRETEGTLCESLLG